MQLAEPLVLVDFGLGLELPCAEQTTLSIQVREGLKWRTIVGRSSGLGAVLRLRRAFRRGLIGFSWLDTMQFCMSISPEVQMGRHGLGMSTLNSVW